jgi:hypothetical protein
MATPHVAGTGALLISRGFTAAQALEQMRDTAKDLGVAGADGFFGCGRINANLAVSMVPAAPCSPPSDTTPPVVAFAAPADGAVLTGGTVTVEVDGTDASPFYAIELYLVQSTPSGGTAWTLLTTSERSPLLYKWHINFVPSGTYTLRARAIDAIGNVGTTSITVTKP